MGHGGKRAGAGRPKGSLGKSTVQLKEELLKAFEELGGAEFLKEVAREDPKAFFALLGKIIPHEIRGSVEHNHELMVVVKDLSGREREAVERQETLDNELLDITPDEDGDV